MENEQFFADEPEVDTRNACRTAEDAEQHSRRSASPLLSDMPPDHELPEEQIFDNVKPQPSWRAPSIWWLLPFGLLFMVGFGGLAVPKINLIISLVCRDYLAEKSLKEPGFTYLPVAFGRDNSHCQIPEVQSLVARFQLYLNLAAGIISALVSPRLGHLSDRYGRTRMIALGAMGAVLNEVITVIVASWPERMPVNLLLVGAMLDGLGGSFTAALALIHSYASDCTPPERRSVAFGLFHGALFFGIAAGPSGAAFLIKKSGGTLPVFYIALALHATFCLAVAFIVPESLSQERQQAARDRHREKTADNGASNWCSWSSWNPIHLVTPLVILLPAVGRPSVLFPTRRGATPTLRRNIVLLAAIDTVVFGVTMGAGQLIIIYAEYMFHWDSVESSLFVSVNNVVRVINLFVVLPIVARLFRTPTKDDGSIRGSDMLDIVLIRLSILFDILGYIGYMLARHPAMMILSGAVASLGGMGSPTLQASLTKHVPPDRIGQMLGVTGLLHALARIIAPTIFNLIYSVTVATYPQAVFVSLAALFGVAFFLSWLIRPYVNLDEVPSHSRDEANEHGYDENTPLLR